MSHSGRLTLFNKDGNEIESVGYYTIEKRRNTIARWMHIHNPQGYYQIDLRPPYVKKKVVVRNVIPDTPKEPIVRPKAEYSNGKSLYPELNNNLN